jgi:hypothetical protein
VWFEIQQKNGRLVRNYLDLLPPGAKFSRPEAGIITGGIAPSMMPAGEHRKLLSWRRPVASPWLEAWEKLNKERFGLKVEACYCSLFDECWLTNASADVPRPVATCEIGRRTTFQG